MKLTARMLFPVLLSITSTTFAVDFIKERFIDVPKNDGSLYRYPLLQVKKDPAHAKLIEARFKNPLQNKKKKVPNSYEIPTSALPPIRDQGQRGTCAYFATVGALESFYIRKDATQQSKLKISEECLVDLRNWEFDQGAAYTGDDKPSDRPDPNGDMPDSIVKTISNNGVPFAKEYKSGVSCAYDGANSAGNDVSLSQYTELFSGDSEAYGKGSSFAIDRAPTNDTIKALITQNIPVEVGVIVYNDYMSGYNWKYNPQTDNDANIAGGHAILLTGYSVKGGKTTFTFKNSWGTNWGKNGYGTIDEGAIKVSWSYDPAFDFTVSLK